MALIEIKKIVNHAICRGFRVREFNYGSVVELFEPTYDGPSAIWSNGSQYSCAQFLVSDSPSIGYGYNSMFNGPFHIGFCQSDNFGLKKLMSHPLFADFRIEA